MKKGRTQSGITMMCIYPLRRNETKIMSSWRDEFLSEIYDVNVLIYCIWFFLGSTQEMRAVEAERKINGQT